MSEQNYNGQIAVAARGKSEVKASFSQSMGKASLGQAMESTVGSQNQVLSVNDMRSMTQNDFAKQIERDDMRRNAVGLRKGSKSAVRDKRYGGGKRSSRGMQQIQ